MIESEFPRPVRLDTIGAAPCDVHFAAEPTERAALAERFGLLALDALQVTAAVRRDAAAVLAEGRVTARVVQSCVVTGEPVPAAIDAPFSLRFVPETEIGAAEELELSDTDCDTLTYWGSAIDLGEAAAETLLLALDPFPRAANAAERLREAGVVGEEDAAQAAAADGKPNPFAVLQALKDKLGG